MKFYQTQGISGLFKGNSAALIRIFPFSATEFYSFEFYKNHLVRGKKDHKNKLFYTFLCGALTGLNAITLTFPLDVVRTRLACKTEHSEIQETNIFRSLKHLYKNEGFRGLYKGYSIVFVGSIPFVAIKQTSFDFLKRNYMVPKYRDALNFLFGSIAGVIGTTLLYPSHLIKRVFHANNDKTLTIRKWIKKTMIEKGIKGFYVGMSVTYVKIIPYQGLIFFTNERMKQLLGYERFDKHHHT